MLLGQLLVPRLQRGPLDGFLEDDAERRDAFVVAVEVDVLVAVMSETATGATGWASDMESPGRIVQRTVRAGETMRISPESPRRSVDAGPAPRGSIARGSLVLRPI